MDIRRNGGNGYGGDYRKDMNHAPFKGFGLQFGKESLRGAISGFIRAVFFLKNIADRGQVSGKSKGRSRQDCN